MRQPAADPDQLILPRLLGAHARGQSGRTVRAYRDALKLFFAFLCQGRSFDRLCSNNLDVERVTRFLTHLEDACKTGRATRNCQLAALQSFVGHLLCGDPSRAEQYHWALAIPPSGTAPDLDLPRIGGGPRAAGVAAPVE